MKLFLRFLPIMLALFVVMPVEAKKKKYPNGDFYEGKWKKGTPHGLGTMTYANGNVYTGNWEFGQYSGHGKLTYAQTSDTISYEGIWLNGKPNGEGTLDLSSGDSYKGNWSDGNFDGKGIMSFSNHDKYDGSWKDGVYDGQGAFYYSNGDRYDGFWKNGKYEGKGIFVSSSGNRYEGMWFNGKYEGQGTLFQEKDNETYKGTWRNGEFVSGTITYTNGKYYQGTYRDNDYVKGKLVDNDEWMEGIWRAGDFYEGTCSATIDGVFYQGEWKCGKFYSGKIQGQFEGMYYDGTWKDGSMYNGTSKGKIRTEEYNGEWKDGKFLKGFCVIETGKDKIARFIGTKDEKGYQGKLLFTSGLFTEGEFNTEFTLDGNYDFVNTDSSISLNGDFKSNKLVKAKGALAYNDVNYSVSITSGIQNFLIKVYKNSSLFDSTTKAELNINDVEDELKSLIADKAEKEYFKEAEKKKKAVLDYCRRNFKGHKYVSESIAFNDPKYTLVFGNALKVIFSVKFISEKQMVFKVDAHPTIKDITVLMVANKISSEEIVDYEYKDGKIYAGDIFEIRDNNRYLYTKNGMFTALLKRVH